MTKTSTRIIDWVQLFTAVAVLAGLILVVIEIRQASELTRLQVTYDGFSMMQNESLTLMGENPINALEKGCYEPENLTYAEWKIMAGRYGQVLARLRRSYLQSSTFGDDRWKQYTINFSIIFETLPGREWWKGQTWVEPEIREEGNRILPQWKINLLRAAMITSEQ